jgi:hypothetical protein
MLKQIVMLALSFCILPKDITSYIFYSSSTSRTLQKFPTTYLHILPEKLGSFYDCIHIYMWFWNFHPNLMKAHHIFHKYTTTTSHKKNSTSSFSSQLRLCLLLLLSLIFNIGTVAAVYNYILPISSLYIMPTLIGYTFIYNSSPISSYSFPSYSHLPSIPTVSESSPNSMKFSYLCAWQSLHKDSHCLLNFNPGGQPFVLIPMLPAPYLIIKMISKTTRTKTLVFNDTTTELEEQEVHTHKRKRPQNQETCEPGLSKAIHHWGIK